MERPSSIVVDLGLLLIGLSLWPVVHSAVQHVAVGLELGLAGVVLLLGIAGAVQRGWRRPR